MISVSFKELAAGRENNATENKMDELFDEYVPGSGPAKTMLGEIVRAWTRLMYRLWNDGDTPYSGYGRETCGPSKEWLIKNVPDVKFPTYSVNDGERKLIDYGTRLLKYFELHPELKTQKNAGSSR